MQLQTETSKYLPPLDSSSEPPVMNAVAASTTSCASKLASDNCSTGFCKEDCAASTRTVSAGHGFYFDDSLSVASDIVSVEDELGLTSDESLTEGPTVVRNVKHKLQLYDDNTSALSELCIDYKLGAKMFPEEIIETKPRYSDSQPQTSPHQRRRRRLTRHNEKPRNTRLSKGRSSIYQNERLAHEEVCKLEELPLMRNNLRAQGHEARLHRPKTQSFRKQSSPQAGCKQIIHLEERPLAERNRTKTASLSLDNYLDSGDSMARSKSTGETDRTFKNRREMLLKSKSTTSIGSTREDRNGKLLTRNNSLRRLPCKQQDYEGGPRSHLQRSNSMRLLLNLLIQPTNEHKQEQTKSHLCSVLDDKSNHSPLKCEDEKKMKSSALKMTKDETKIQFHEEKLTFHGKETDDDAGSKERKTTSDHRLRRTKKDTTKRKVMGPSRSSQSLASDERKHRGKRDTLSARSYSSSNLQSMARHDVNNRGRRDRTKRLQSTKSLWSSDRQIMDNWRLSSSRSTASSDKH